MCQADVDMDGDGTGEYVVVYAHRNPDLWPEPELRLRVYACEAGDYVLKGDLPLIWYYDNATFRSWVRIVPLGSGAAIFTGGITEADVALADASNAIIFGFNVVPDENARVLAEQKGVQIRRYDIIYKMTDDIKAAMEGMLKPEEKETELGRIVVQKRFVISHVGTIAGCRVLSGMVQRGCRVRLIRENRIIGDYAIDTLKREKDDVKEVQQGYECGIKLQNFNDIKEGDVFEAYKIEEVSRKL